MTTQGYQRIVPGFSPDAVAWWYVVEFEDGYVYARGGRCRTTRDARDQLRIHASRSRHDHVGFAKRPTARLMSDGSLEPIDYGPYGVEHRR